MRQQPLLIFLHLPKTAGSTLVSILERQYGASSTLSLYGSSSSADLQSFPTVDMASYHVILGHFYFGVHRNVGEAFQYMTLMRHPVDRVISHYYYVRNDPTHYLYPLASQLSLEAYIAACGQAEPNNDQTRLLAGTDDPPGSGMCSPALLPVARKNLEEFFSVVGLTEEFDRSLLLMKRVLRWRMPCYTRQNVSASRLKRGIVSTQSLRILQSYNQLDLELYETARQIFYNQLRRHGYGIDLELSIFKRMNEIYNTSRRLAAFIKLRT